MTKPAKKEIRQQQMVEATMRCIVDKGFGNFSVKDIAREAGLSTGVIYHYFENKEEILLQVLKEAFRTSRDQVLREVDPLPDPRQKLLAYIDSMLAVTRDNPTFHVVLLNYLGQAPSNPEFARTIRRFLHGLTAYVAGFGAAREDQNHTLAALVIALGLGLNTLAGLGGEEYAPATLAPAFKELIQTYLP
ncbi:MAG: TetR/AcrR family transcriptional regulator [Deltaproteobacteria bacterium]|nr:TetR/AcrR family transcriptional regulator [Deltaproteobacteria bacterium]